MMDFPGVLARDPAIAGKIRAAFETREGHIDGHAPGLSGRDLNAYLARPGFSAQVKTLKDIIEFNDRNREKEMPFFGQKAAVTKVQRRHFFRFYFILPAYLDPAEK